jgi:hypothetical protein
MVVADFRLHQKPRDEENEEAVVLCEGGECRPALFVSASVSGQAKSSEGALTYPSDCGYLENSAIS